MFGFLLSTVVVSAQVKLKLSLLPDGKTYEVSMTPESTWESPLNTTGSVQVVVAVPGSDPFLVKNLESKIQGITWSDDSYVENPPAAPGWQFIAFTVNELGNRSMPFEAGKETPLFSFCSAKGDCSEGILLLDNNDPMVKAVVKNKFNITQNITVLGMRGNACAGIAQAQVDCPEKPVEQAESWVSKVKANPIPAATYVDFSWVNGEGLETLELQLFNDKGQVIKKNKLNTKPGAQTFQVELDKLSQGIYSATFIANDKQKETLRLTVMP